MKTIKQTILAALQQARGDDTARAKQCFRFCSPAQMQEEFGMSGKTRAEVLAEYEASDREIDTAIEWTKTNCTA